MPSAEGSGPIIDATSLLQRLPFPSAPEGKRELLRGQIFVQKKQTEDTSSHLLMLLTPLQETHSPRPPRGEPPPAHRLVALDKLVVRRRGRHTYVPLLLPGGPAYGPYRHSMAQGEPALVLSDTDSAEDLEEVEPSFSGINFIAHEVNENQRSIEEICICCGSFQIHTQHPLFHGGICTPCTNHLEIYQPLSAWERKPINVLSLFDNITTEMKNLGFLGSSLGDGRLTYLDDVTNALRTDVKEWGPFDFIFGSTPPVGNSYEHPPAWYFYQYHRILQYGKPPESSQRPFFWMFVDNLVLEKEDRETASRFFKGALESPLQHVTGQLQVQCSDIVFSEHNRLDLTLGYGSTAPIQRRFATA
ncbi:DNA (cytosine-5)-methyltransferase 3-like protein [Chelonia mydas]|uniref:DNA (Cytosine-5)-methyltransferase 3-like protein n=1 Tax=Chelonia mydas TaxID=8469 RepID=M7B7H4_CHEMY|nr:DNA (cytosine-5)-methyltransferase 3-like protein [Chelonia mydas]